MPLDVLPVIVQDASPEQYLPLMNIDEYRRALRRLKNLEEHYPRASDSRLVERLRQELDDMRARMTAEERREGDTV